MPMKTLRSNSGFTLIEALVAMVVLTIGILSLYSMQIKSIQGNSKANRFTTASTWNADQMEKIVGMDYNDATLKDTNQNGTNQDADGDGVDDDGGNFGLDDSDSAADIPPFTTSDGRYTLYLNVAVDVPMKNLKTIRVHVQDNSQTLSGPVTFTYIKDDII